MSRNTVVTETLTDGSKVFNVTTQSDDGGLVLFACISQAYAESLKNVLDLGVVDVSLRDAP